MKTIAMWLRALVGASVAFGTAAWADPVAEQRGAAVVRYELTAPGQTSLGVYDADGVMVRTLLSKQERPAGANAEIWDGLDDRGNAVPAGQYSFKVLRLPGPLTAEWISRPGNGYPSGKGQREGAPGNHAGPNTVAVDETGIYISSSNTENVATDIKLSRDGERRLWNNTATPQAWHGTWAIAVVGDTVYRLQSNHRITRQKPDQATPDYKAGWDVVWRDHPDTAEDEEDARVGTAGRPDALLDMAAYQPRKADEAVLVVSYRDHDEVRWLDPKTGQMIDHANVPDPLGVAVDDDGDVLVVSGTQVVRVSREDKTPRPVVTGLSEPWRIDVERGKGRLLVADRGDSQQIKRFVLPKGGAKPVETPEKAWGRAGGRRFGLHAPGDFRNVSDIAADGDGGFVVAEPTWAPRRVAHVRADGSVQEWVGGYPWSPAVMLEGESADAAWIETEKGFLTRFTLDNKTGTWTTHSNYRYADLAGLVGGYGGPGGGQWHVRERNGQTYLVRTHYIQVLKLDKTDWSLRAVAVGRLGSEEKGEHFLWTDLNDNGREDEGERTVYKDGPGWKPHPNAIDNDGDFNYYYYNQYDNVIRTIRVDRWTEQGVPVYAGVGAKDIAVVTDQIPDYDKLGYNTKTNLIFWRAAGEDAPLYGAFNFGRSEVGVKDWNNEKSWGQAKSSKLGKWDVRTGRLIWAVGKQAVNDDYNDRFHQIEPGEIWSDFRRLVGGVRGTLVVNDYNGGYRGLPPAHTYVWDTDGLFVGGLFDAVDLSKGRVVHDYAMSSENLASDIIEDKRTGDVYYLSTRENEARLYRIRGWDGWERKTGSVTLATAGTDKTGVGLAAQAFPDAAFKQPAGEKQLAAGVGAPIDDAAAVRYTGELTVPAKDWYTFHVSGGAKVARLWVDGRQILEGDVPAGDEGAASRRTELEPGRRYDVRVDVVRGGDPPVTFAWSTPARSREAVPTAHLFPAGDVPVKVSTVSVPGVVQAEQYDAGGEGFGYHDNTPGNTRRGNSRWREDDVEVEYRERPDAPPAYVDHDVVASSGEWLQYTIEVPRGGRYDLTVWLRSKSAGLEVAAEVDGKPAGGPVTAPDTKNELKPIPIRGVELRPGVRRVRLVLSGADPEKHVAGIDRIEFTPDGR